jgi:hypothetical protein
LCSASLLFLSPSLFWRTLSLSHTLMTNTCQSDGSDTCDYVDASVTPQYPASSKFVVETSVPLKALGILQQSNLNQQVQGVLVSTNHTHTHTHTHIHTHTHTHTHASFSLCRILLVDKNGCIPAISHFSQFPFVVRLREILNMSPLLLVVVRAGVLICNHRLKSE